MVFAGCAAVGAGCDVGAGPRPAEAREAQRAGACKSGRSTRRVASGVSRFGGGWF